MAKNVGSNRLTDLIVKVCRTHFVVALILAVQILLYHAWALITPQATLSRWVATAIFFVIVAIVWYKAKNASSDMNARQLVFTLITADIALASYGVYTQRGMAARAVALYALPLIVASILASRSALLTTAAVCVAAYSVTALTYFVVNFNEGFKIELYGEVGFYSALIFVFAWLLWQVRSRHRN